MTGTLYAIGVGPGDPELMTLKAARILGRVGSICVPKGKEEGASLALSIARKAVSLDGKEIVEAFFPMKRRQDARAGRELDAQWGETVRLILSRLERGIDTAFLTLGDPAFYSTFFYLYDRLLAANPALPVEIVPGVSSINASAAAAGIALGLGDRKIAILPKWSPGELEAVLGRFDTVVLMKVYKALDALVEALSGLGLLEKAVCVSRAGLPGERVFRDLRLAALKEIDYFSLVIVRK